VAGFVLREETSDRVTLASQSIAQKVAGCVLAAYWLDLKQQFAEQKSRPKRSTH